MTREEQIITIKRMAKFFKDNPELPMPTLYSDQYVWLESKFELADVINLLLQSKIDFEKYYTDDNAGVTVKIGQLKIHWLTSRGKVCRPKVVETRTIPAQPERTYEHVVEWECEPMLELGEELAALNR